MRLVSWNVNGIRAIMKKDFPHAIQKINADILCFQETKAQGEEVQNELAKLSGYHFEFNSAQRKGYSGVAILSKQPPLRLWNDMGLDEHDQEGRVISAEWPDFILVNVYTPNSGEGLVRLGYREQWDRAFKEYVLKLSQTKPVIICGDLNVAHQPIDIARPKENYNKSAGYTQVEIDGFVELLELGFVDTFRHLHPEDIAYTYWNYKFLARERNVGWRIDYFLFMQSLMPRLRQAFVLGEFMGSDHCPVGVEISLS